jgi:hypothetical protein
MIYVEHKAAAANLQCIQQRRGVACAGLDHRRGTPHARAQVHDLCRRCLRETRLRPVPDPRGALTFAEIYYTVHAKRCDGIRLLSAFAALLLRSVLFDESLSTQLAAATPLISSLSTFFPILPSLSESPCPPTHPPVAILTSVPAAVPQHASTRNAVRHGNPDGTSIRA